jgi:3-isopropylmalate/(R)-2-methylmalate dehydratase large subunit
VADDFRLYVVPSSAKIMAEAARLGYLERLVEAGAWISSPTCDFCYGKTQYLFDGEAAISTGTLNIPGRMGSVSAEIYLGSAASVAAAAIEGTIADPRNFL